MELRVGAKGYIHGWIFVGAHPEVGQNLTDPKNHPGEYGVITAINDKGVHVTWSGGLGKKEVKPHGTVKPQPAIGHPVYDPVQGWGHVKNKKGDQVQVQWHGHGGSGNAAAMKAHEDYKAAKKLAADKHLAKKSGTSTAHPGATEAPPAPASEPAKMPTSTFGMTPVDGPHGSNPGQWYKADDGKQYYLKSSPDAANEVGAAKVYEAAGLVPGKDIAATSNVNGKVLSQKVDGLHALSGSQWTTDAEARESAKKFFAASALTANYDAAGLGHDNLLKHSDGHVAMIDLGGAMERRAQGGVKPGWKKPGEPNRVSMAEDVEAMSGDGMVKNPQLKRVFGGMTDEEKANALEDLHAKLNNDEALNKLRNDLMASGQTSIQANRNIEIIKGRLDEVPAIVAALKGTPEPHGYGFVPKAQAPADGVHNLKEHPDVTATKLKLEQTAKKLNEAHAAHQSAKTDETKKALANAASMHSKTKAKLIKLQAQHGAPATPYFKKVGESSVPTGTQHTDDEQAKLQADVEAAKKKVNEAWASFNADPYNAAKKQAYHDAVAAKGQAAAKLVKHNVTAKADAKEKADAFAAAAPPPKPAKPKKGVIPAGHMTQLQASKSLKEAQAAQATAWKKYLNAGGGEPGAAAKADYKAASEKVNAAAKAVATAKITQFKMADSQELMDAKLDVFKAHEETLAAHTAYTNALYKSSAGVDVKHLQEKYYQASNKKKAATKKVAELGGYSASTNAHYTGVPVPPSNAGTTSYHTMASTIGADKTTVGKFNGLHIAGAAEQEHIDQFVKDHINVHPTEHKLNENTESSKALFKHLNEFLNKQMPTWEPGVKEAVTSYTGNAYHTVNDPLRAIDAGQAQVSSATKAKILKIDKGFAPAEQDIAVARRVGGPDFFGTKGSQGIKVGDVIADPGFGSSTITLGSFGTGEYGTTTMHIVVPKGTPVNWVKPISLHGHENELLLDRDQPMVITRIEYNASANRTDVHAIAIPKQLVEKQSDLIKDPTH